MKPTIRGRVAKVEKQLRKLFGAADLITEYQQGLEDRIRKLELAVTARDALIDKLAKANQALLDEQA